MALTFRTRSLAMAAVALNAVKPHMGQLGSVPAFALGWPTIELAPQLLAVGVADTAQYVVRHRRRGDLSIIGLGAAAVAAGTLGYLIVQSRGAGNLTRSGISESLGASYLDDLKDEVFDDTGSTLRQIAHPFRLIDPEVEVIRDINYREGGSRARLDIYKPKGVDLTNAPVLLQVHGGGWVIGDKGQQGLILMNAMAKRGWVCVSVNYRLAPKNAFPAQIIDVKRAIAWTKKHIASYGGDPSYIVVTGGSAGGHLSSLAAVTPNDPQFQPGFEDEDTTVQACVPFYGVYDVGGIIGDAYSKGIRDGFFAPRVLQRDPKTDPQPFLEASPLYHVNGDEPDFLILHGQRDSLVQVSQAREFVKALKKHSKNVVTYVELPGAQHAFEVFGSIRSRHVIKAAERWLVWHRARFVNGAESVPATSAAG